MDSSTLFTLAWKASSCAVSLSVVSWRREWDGDDEPLAHKAGGGLLHPTGRGQYWVLQSVVALPNSAGSSYFDHCSKHTAPPLHTLGDDVRAFKAGGSLAFKIHANRARCPCPFSSLTAPSTRLSCSQRHITLPAARCIPVSILLPCRGFLPPEPCPLPLGQCTPLLWLTDSHRLLLASLSGLSYLPLILYTQSSWTCFSSTGTLYFFPFLHGFKHFLFYFSYLRHSSYPSSSEKF